MGNNNVLKVGLCVAIIVLVSLILYHNPLFSNKQLGLDALGHLTKISYIQEFGLAKWDMSWYSGSPFLKFYSPLFYYAATLFENIIFGSNFLCFFSLLMTAIGIFLLVYCKTNSKKMALISSLAFLSVIASSYYYVSVGNHPYVFAIWTIPFSILFLEKCFTKKMYLIPLSVIFLISVLSHVFIVFVIVGLILIRILARNEFKLKNFKKIIYESFVVLTPLILICAFWLIPFLAHSSSFVGDEIGYIPLPHHLFGLGDYKIWGVGAGEIGISFLIFLVITFLFLRKQKNKSEFSKNLIISCVIYFLLLMGVLWKYYPTGIGAIRFILPFAILMSISIGTLLNELNVRKIFLVLIFALLIFGLFINYNKINENYNFYSYHGRDSRYDFMQRLLDNNILPFNNSINNFRFGTTRFIFAETINFFWPKISQTWGYYDQGMLNPDIMLLMKKSIWGSDDLNSTLYFLDWFGIKYFEIGGEDYKFASKFENNSDLFLKIDEKHIADYPFTIYEFKKSSPIAYYLKTNVYSYKNKDTKIVEEMAKKNEGIENKIPIISDNEILIENNYSLLNYTFERENPDEVIVNLDYEDGGVILFKEFYYLTWKAKEMPSGNNVDIYETITGFMLAIPSQSAEKIIFYQSVDVLEIAGYIMTFLGIFILILAIKLPTKFSK